EEADEEEGIDQQNIFDSVILFLTALTRRLGSRVLGADDPPFRPVMGKRGEVNVPTARNETRPSGGLGPLTVSRCSLPFRFLAAHTADELECDAHGGVPLGLRGGVMPAMLSECIDAPQYRRAPRRSLGLDRRHRLG